MLGPQVDALMTTTSGHSNEISLATLRPNRGSPFGPAEKEKKISCALAGRSILSGLRREGAVQRLEWVMAQHVLLIKAAIVGDLEVLLIRCRTERAGITPSHLYDLLHHLERALVLAYDRFKHFHFSFVARTRRDVGSFFFLSA